MARKKEKPIIDVEKLREIETYDHKDKKRSNNPPVGMAHYDTVEEKEKKYEFDPHLDPTLQWAGKTEGTSFNVPTSSIHIHESIKPHKIIKSVQTIDDSEAPLQLSLFDNPIDRMKLRREAIEFYQHGKDWTNRMIAGDSLVIMNSLLEKEGMAGQVQMVYVDPPYGIKYGSNFQPFVNKRDVKDGKDEDLSQEPEMVKAFRDTWELGIHSYLTYLRNRLLLARELLAESGSIFIQISDENMHLVRNILDEIFGAKNFVSLIWFKKTGGLVSSGLTTMGDYLIWYAKSKDNIKFRRLFRQRTDEMLTIGFSYMELPNGDIVKLTSKQLNGEEPMPKGRRFQSAPIVSGGEKSADFEYNGKLYSPPGGGNWKTSNEGMRRLASKGRIFPIGNTLTYKKYADDFPYTYYTNIWDDTMQSTYASQKLYVVQTATKVIERCMLMSTDPGDLVLDITCGSGTTAYVAEQWGRRWITCDTSRVAITLAKQRLMTAIFDYYKLAHEEQGVSSGFIYKTVPHITLSSIANNEPPALETLFDQPEIDKKR